MHPGGDHRLASGQPGADQYQVAVGPGHHHRLGVHHHRRPVHQPHRRLLALLEHCRQRQLDDTGHRRGVDQHAGGLAQAQRGGADVGLDQKGAGGRVCRCGHLAHRGGQQGCALTPGTQLQRAHLAEQCAQGRSPVLGHAEDGVARAVRCQTQHRRAGGQHRTGLGFNRRDHTGRICLEHRVTGLVALQAGLGLGLGGLGPARLERRLAPLQFQPADETLLAQLFVALELGLAEVLLGGGGIDRCPRRILAQPQIAGVNLRQGLARRHRVAQVGHAPHQLAAHPEGQVRLGAWPHLGGVFMLQRAGARLHGQRAHGAHRLFNRQRLGASQQDRQNHQR